jgi:hypothetical protein
VVLHISSITGCTAAKRDLSVSRLERLSKQRQSQLQWSE